MVGRVFSSGNLNFVSLNANEADVNVFTKAGSPASAVDVIVTIAAGVIIYQNAGVAALRTGALPAGSTLKIVNHGFIVGGGGPGGNGGADGGGAVGSAGGPAIYRDVNCPLTIDNTDGYIFGGGGGGGGGASSSAAFGGGGGGGGIGYNNAGGGSGGYGSTTPGDAGGAGSGSAPGGGGAGGGGTGGSGGSGGNWGDPGDDGQDTTGFGGGTGGSGGAAGNAVKLNGGTAPTWTPASANNSAQVKGPIA